MNSALRSLALGGAIAFFGALLCSVLQLVVFRSLHATKAGASLGSAAGLPLLLGFSSLASLGIAVSQVQILDFSRMAMILACHVGGLFCPLLFRKRRFGSPD